MADPCACSNGDSQQVLQSAVVVLSDPLLKRALSRREKHELLYAAAILALGRDKSLKQQSVSFQTLSVMAAVVARVQIVILACGACRSQRPVRHARLCCLCFVWTGRTIEVSPDMGVDVAGASKRLAQASPE